MRTEAALLEANPAGAVIVFAIYGLLVLLGTVSALTLLARHFRAPSVWLDQAAALRARAWTWRDAAFVTGAFVLLTVFGVAVSYPLRAAAPAALLVVESLALDGLGILLLAAYVRRRGLTWSGAFGTSRRAFAPALRTGLRFYLAALPILVVASVVYELILSAHGIPLEMQEVALIMAAADRPWLRVYLFVLAVGLAPVFEETLFRGIALPALAKLFGAGPAVLITAVLFAAIHLHLPSFVPLTVIAVAFSLGYLCTGSLWVPIAMHALFNGVNLTLLFILRA